MSRQRVEKRLEDMDETEARFLALLTDTEGCISTKSYRQPFFAVKMASLLPLRMCEKWGGTISKNKPEKGKLLYRWDITPRNVLRVFLEKIKPYLVLKQKQAELALQMIDILGPLHSKINEEQRKQLKALNDEIHKYIRADVPDIDLTEYEERSK
jgi:hypothetical protein